MLLKRRWGRGRFSREFIFMLLCSVCGFFLADALFRTIGNCSADIYNSGGTIAIRLLSENLKITFEYPPSYVLIKGGCFMIFNQNKTRFEVVQGAAEVDLPSFSVRLWLQRTDRLPVVIPEIPGLLMSNRLSTRKVLTLFTTLPDSAGLPKWKVRTYKRSIRHHSRELDFNFLIFTSDPYWRIFASGLGVEISQYAEKDNGTGLPYLRSMFQISEEIFEAHFVGYANCDILFDTERLRTTLRTLITIKVAIVGRRVNIPLLSFQTKEMDYSLESANAHIRKIVENSVAFVPDAQDYIIHTKGAIKWDEMPLFVVGRVAYHNFLVDYFHKQKDIHLVDGTGSVIAVHQTGEDVISNGHLAKDKGDKLNLEAAKRLGFHRGKQCVKVTCAALETKVITSESICPPHPCPICLMSEKDSCIGVVERDLLVE